MLNLFSTETLLRLLCFFSLNAIFIFNQSQNNICGIVNAVKWSVQMFVPAAFNLRDLTLICSIKFHFDDLILAHIQKTTDEQTGQEI